MRLVLALVLMSALPSDGAPANKAAQRVGNRSHRGQRLPRASTW